MMANDSSSHFYSNKIKWKGYILLQKSQLIFYIPKKWKAAIETKIQVSVSGS